MRDSLSLHLQLLLSGTLVPLDFFTAKTPWTPFSAEGLLRTCCLDLSQETPWTPPPPLLRRVLHEGLT